MKFSKNITIRSIGYGIIFLISCILVFSAVSCHMQTDLQKTVNTTIPRNITFSSSPANQPQASTPYFNDGSIKCYCGHGSVFILNANPNPDIKSLENRLLEESIHTIMQDIDDACREYQKNESVGSSGDKNKNGDKKNTDTADQDITSGESGQNTEITDETNDVSQENQQVINANDFIYNMLYLINTARNQSGLPALNLNESVCNVASMRSQDMVDRNYFSHTTPEGKNIFNILQECGIAYGAAGENIQYSYPPSNASPGQYFNTWMASKQHRDIIMSGNFSQIGIGVSFNNSKVVAVLVFTG